LALRDWDYCRIGSGFHYTASFTIAIVTANGTRVP
jgi:hypothetical protein